METRPGDSFPLSKGCRPDVHKTEHRENCIHIGCVGCKDRTLIGTGGENLGQSLVLDASGVDIGPGRLSGSYLKGAEFDIGHGQGWST